MGESLLSVTVPSATTLSDVLDAALADTARDAAPGSVSWQRATAGFWTAMGLVDQPGPAQGWKLHVSATPASAATVLARALPVLLAGRSAFKFATTIDQVAELNARHTSRGQSGKFLTVYPGSDEDAVRLAEALHEATEGLPGPRILSDRPYRPGSLVHYRYGAFVEERRISNDGLYAWVIFDPDGNPVEDRRVGQYVPPAWAVCPFPVPAPDQAAVTVRDGAVLVGDRFLVRQAIRHVNKGGVYWAVDTVTGADAILKEARPHVASDMRGRDVRDLLRAEARVLELLGPLGAAPLLLAVFEQSGHLFLAEELVPGVTLQDWVLDRIRTGGWRRHVPDAVPMAERLVELLALAHEAGLVLRDLTPANVMVQPTGELRLIDLELAILATEEDPMVGAGTRGFGAPEQLAGGASGIDGDYFSLGANICFVLTGSTPMFLPEVPLAGSGPRPWRERLSEWLAVRTAPGTPPEITALVLGLMEHEPADRWTIAQARSALAAASAAPAVDVAPAGARPAGRPEIDGTEELGDEQWHRAVDGIVGHLLGSMTPDDDERLWTVSPAHGSPDPCIVQLGAAGVLGVLTQCLEFTGDQRLPAAIADTGRWISRRVGADVARPGGLYFGGAGIAWALLDAGRAIDDDRLVDAALALAERLAVSSPNPDVTHGTAGMGVAFLHLWHRTGNPAFLRRATESADVLVASADDGPDGLIWGTPAAFDSRLAGGRFYGFAHGTAGVGHFLLAAAVATGRSDCLALANQAGETLLSTATLNEGMALWGPGPGDPTTAPYWCHGSAGIGSFLTRLHRVTGDDRFDKTARLAAQAVMENSWRGVLGQCHGLAGNGESLLDMADSTGDPAYLQMAHQLARILYAGRAVQGGHVVFPDEDGGLSASFSDGVSGILAFLLRLRHRSPRLWMVDDLLEGGRAT